MMLPRIPVPSTDDYPDFYQPYVARVRELDLIARMRDQPIRLGTALDALAEAATDHRYAAGKWSVKEVVGHLADTERVFAYRLFRIGRGDSTPLSGFDENVYVEAARFGWRTISALLEDFEAVRESTLHLMAGMNPDAWSKRGIANGHPITAGALAFIMAGHVEHHMEILRSRYGIMIPGVEG